MKKIKLDKRSIVIKGNSIKIGAILILITLFVSLFQFK